ncbi:MAG: YwbE family protein [Spirochaetes bacterium]|jgi:uncharacterized repeat protein (TIGR03833 family)|nr:YwbE family protein [Spirochaetota bacterium]
MNNQKRESIRSGLKVAVVKKNDQQKGILTEGIVETILTNSAFHPHGIKVRLTDGSVGRVKQILE